MERRELERIMNYVYEYCNYCESEVKIKNIKFKLQICPSCGALILPCSMCEDNDYKNCAKCENNK